MRLLRLPFLLIALLPLTLEAQQWSASVATGPFVFGDFARRTFRLTTEDGAAEHTLTLSAATRAGLSVGIERNLGDRWGVGVMGTFTHAPLAIEGDDGDSVELDAGDIDIATIAIPIVFHVNRNGNFRAHLYAGPAHAAYRLKSAVGGQGVPVFEGTRSDWGVVGGVRLSWRLSDHLAVEGAIDDTVTQSPFRKEDVPGGGSRVEIPNPHNVHTTVGLRWMF
jgi:hypothetical protein